MKNTDLKIGRLAWSKVGDRFGHEIDLGRRILEIDQMARLGDFDIRILGTVDGEEIKVDFALKEGDREYLALGSD
ncbi:MAG: hypothetical protein AAGB46_04915 [Verrucomicrobiota bacterium]